MSPKLPPGNLYSGSSRGTSRFGVLSVGTLPLSPSNEIAVNFARNAGDTARFIPRQRLLPGWGQRWLADVRFDR